MYNIAWVCTRLSDYTKWFSVSVGSLSVQTKESLVLVSCLGHFSLHLFVLSNSDVLDFVLSYFFLFYHRAIKASLFSNERLKCSECEWDGR